MQAMNTDAEASSLTLSGVRSLFWNASSNAMLLQVRGEG